MSEIKEAKSLRWLAIQFPLVENPKDDIEKLQSCINLYCTAAAEKIEQLTEDNDKLYRLVDDKIQENKRLTEENERLREHNITLEQKLMLLGIDDVYVFKAKVKGE